MPNRFQRVDSLIDGTGCVSLFRVAVPIPIPSLLRQQYLLSKPGTELSPENSDDLELLSVLLPS